MTFEEIKRDREFIELTPKQINWLIAEVERLQGVEGRTVDACNRARKEAAERCAEIADYQRPDTAAKIREEFNLGP